MKRPALALLLVAVVVLTGTGAGHAQQAPPRDRAAPGSATGGIRGRVLDTAGAALGNARVQVASDAGPPPSVLTDRDGRFVVASLAAGQYRVTASKPGYIPTSVGARRFRDPGVIISVESGATTDAGDLRLPRAAALSGRIVDSLGYPVIGMIVNAEMRTGEADGQPLVAAAITETDDLGEYRLSSLPEGRFLVSVSVNTDLAPFVGGGNPVNAGLMTRIVGPDGRVVSTVVNTPRARTYYPGVPGDRDAQWLTLVAGEERSSIDFTVPASEPRTLEQMLAGGGRGGRGGTAGFRGAIRGRVVRADGQPIAQALVRLRSDDYSGLLPTAFTDNDGRYELGNLPAGRFTVIAGKPGFMGAEYGARRALGPGDPVTLGPGDTRDRLDITLPLPATLSGRVLDSMGDPVEGAFVRLLQLEYEAGRRQLAFVPVVRARRTDDRGVYRLFGLQPGTYIVGVLAGEPVPGEAFTDLTAIAELPGYVLTYFPASANPNEAQLVAVGLSQQVEGVELTVPPVPLARVSGTVVDAAGRPAPGGVTFSQSRRSGAMAAPPRTSAIQPDGTFAFANVPPGDYVLQSRKAGNNAYVEPEFASLFVTVTGTDVPGLVLRMSNGSTVTGRITLEGTSEPPPWSAIDLSARPVDLDRAPLVGNPRASARLREDWTFEMAGLNGPRVFRLEYVPRGWMLKAVRADGVDVTDTPLEFGRPDQSVRDLEVVLTDRVTELSGRVVDERGREVADCTVVIFAEDRRQWIPASRFLAANQPAQDGRFSVRDLPPGDYYAAAIDRILAGEWQDPDLLDMLLPGASRVRLTEAESISVSLKLIVR